MSNLINIQTKKKYILKAQQSHKFTTMSFHRSYSYIYKRFTINVFNGIFKYFLNYVNKYIKFKKKPNGLFIPNS